MKAFLLSLALAAAAAAPGKNAPAPAAPPQVQPVLLELFTSQGSGGSLTSEQLLSSWGARLFKSGQALPLAFHVDTLDELGWKDPYSSPEFTARQREYAERLETPLFLPQFVLGGKSMFMGGNGEEAEKQLKAWQYKEPAAKLAMSPPRRDKKGRLVLPITVEPAAQPKRDPKRFRVRLLVFESGLTTRVGAGENAGKTVRNDFVVRWIKDLGSIRKDDHRPWSKEAPFEWDASWKAENAGAVLLLQDDDSLQQRGLALLSPIPPIP